MQTSSNFPFYASYKIDIHKKDKQGAFQYIKQLKEIHSKPFSCCFKNWKYSTLTKDFKQI